MEYNSRSSKLLDDLTGMHEPGRQRAFSLGNPWYCKESSQSPYLLKELPTGELFRVLVNYEFDEEGYCTAMIETFSERIK